MIGSWEIEQLDNPDLFHDLAVAYLDISIVTTRSMVYGAFLPRFSHSRAVLSMTYHAIELFLKGAILRATGDKKCTGHILEELYRRYEDLYPGQDMHFDIPFGVVYLGFTPEQVAEMQKEEPPQDQMYRYHTNLAGERWEGIDGFDAESFLPMIESLKETMVDLGRKIHWRADTGQQGLGDDSEIRPEADTFPGAPQG